MVAMFLQYLCNKYGDFDVCRIRKLADGTRQSSKWRSVMTCWSDEYLLNDWLPYVNNRQVLRGEIALDIDRLEHETDAQILDRYNAIIKKLQTSNLPYAGFFNGSKGYHIHIFSEELHCCNVDVTRFKRNVIEALGCDVLKASQRNMIALEGAPHWKTGNKKTLLEQNRMGGFYDTI